MAIMMEMEIQRGGYFQNFYQQRAKFQDSIEIGIYI